MNNPLYILKKCATASNPNDHCDCHPKDSIACDRLRRCITNFEQTLICLHLQDKDDTDEYGIWGRVFVIAKQGKL
jgi:hypothetical protein